MSIFGFQEPPTQAYVVPPRDASPVSVNELRHLFYLVDAALNNTAGRLTYTAEQVQDLLLDVRSILERLSSPVVLLELAKSLYIESKEFADEVKRAG